MPAIIRQSVILHRMGTNSFVEFEPQKVLHENFTFFCKDWLGRFILKLQAMKCAYEYDDLNSTLRVEIQYPSQTRIVQYKLV